MQVARYRPCTIRSPAKCTGHGAIEPQLLRAGASALGSQHLINSKLKPPLCAAACIERRPLLARLDAAFKRKLVLLAAPIGSGKTTLLAQWYRRVTPAHAVAWLSLDERDNDPVRFFSYLIGAVHGAAPGFDAYIASRHTGEVALPIDPAAALFSESLDRVDKELTIVLDDFQWLTAPSLIRTIDFLLYRSPDTVHWIISGRCMPEVGLSQLRLTDQLTIIDAEDLNFDDGLIVQLSRKLCRRALSPEEAAGVKARTEGWVAGTKLALLAAAAGPAAAETLQEFAGSHSEVARYLGASVLHEQNAEIREFLVASSVVDRMTGELCNALLGISHSQSLLERLERSQLFVQPLDSHGHWYRYHTLFLDFLRSVLRRDAARIPVLHERASRWFAEHQLYEEALHHAFLANDPNWRIELLARCLASWLQEGEVAEVIRWSERLPRTEILTHASIGTAYIAALILCRRFDDATIALREVEALVAAGRIVGPMHLQLLHAMLTILADSDCHVSIADADSVRLEGADGFLSSTVLTLQAYALLRRNKFDLAWRLSMRARDALENVSLYGFGYAEVVASLAERAQGDMKSAAERCERMFAAVRRGRRNPAWVNAANALACVRYEENRLTEAEALIREVLPLLSVASTVENFTIAYLTLARIKAINERFAEAFQLLDYLHSVLESGCHQRFLAQVYREKMRLHLLQNNASRALGLAIEVRARTSRRVGLLAAGAPLRRRVGTLRVCVHAAAGAWPANRRGPRHPYCPARQRPGGGLRLSRSGIGGGAVGMRVACRRSGGRVPGAESRLRTDARLRLHARRVRRYAGADANHRGRRRSAGSFGTCCRTATSASSAMCSASTRRPRRHVASRRCRSSR